VAQTIVALNKMDSGGYKEDFRADLEAAKCVGIGFVGLDVL